MKKKRTVEVSVSLRMPEDLAYKSAAAAALHGISRAQLIRKLLEQFIAEDSVACALQSVKIDGRNGIAGN